MTPPPGYKIWLWLGAAFALISSLKLYGWKRERDGVRKAERKSDQEARRLAKSIRDETDERTRNVRAKRDAVPDGARSGRLSYKARRFLSRGG